MQDPSLQVRVTLEHGDRMVIMFIWGETYDADALSRSSVALQLIAQVVGRSAQLLGQPATDWPFLN
jgi:hypothetical protein